MTADETRPDPISLEIRRGSPTDEELAAVLAVVSESYQREAADARVDERARPSAWAHSRRMRRPVASGTWGRFAG